MSSALSIPLESTGLVSCCFLDEHMLTHNCSGGRESGVCDFLVVEGQWCAIE